MAGGGIHAELAEAHRDGSRDEEARRRDVGEAGTRSEREFREVEGECPPVGTRRQLLEKDKRCADRECYSATQILSACRTRYSRCRSRSSVWCSRVTLRRSR